MTAFPSPPRTWRGCTAPLGWTSGRITRRRSPWQSSPRSRSARAGRPGSPLRERQAPLHPRPIPAFPERFPRRDNSMLSVGLMVLAAGGSRRLGTPKQLLPDSMGRTLLRRAAQTALGSSCRPVAVVLGAFTRGGATGGRQPACTTVVNDEWATGLASSLRAGLTALTEFGPLDAVIVMLCDQPLVTPALLDSLIDARRTTRHDVVACEYDDILGVPALFGSALFGALATLERRRRRTEDHPRLSRPPDPDPFSRRQSGCGLA